MLLETIELNEQGPSPLVVLHGLFGAKENWRSQGLAWANDRRVVMMDLRNHGLSKHDKHMDYALMSEDVISTMDQLGLNKVDILGHSMGGKVAMQLALNDPKRVNSLVVADISPVAYPPRHQAIMTGLKSLKLDQVKSRKQALGLLNAYETNINVCQFLLKSLYKNDHGVFALRYNLQAIENNYTAISAAPLKNDFHPKGYTGPTLVIKGDQSNYIVAEHKTDFDKFLPNATLKVMKGCGHWLHAEKPELFCSLVTRFLQEQHR
jgi:esterase